ncbi:MAG: hypothetical protein ACREXN_04895 [Polaromonas sp.]
MKLLLINPNISDSVSGLIHSASPGTAQRGSFAPPPLKPNRGLPPAIARLLDRTA